MWMALFDVREKRDSFSHFFFVTHVIIDRLLFQDIDYIWIELEQDM